MPLRRNKKPKLTPYDIGKDGTVEQFVEASSKAVNHKRHVHYGLDEYLGEADQRELRRGAIQAFKDEHPENIQTALLYPKDFAILEGEFGFKLEEPRIAILSDLIKGSSTPGADVKRALEKIPEQIDQLLYVAINGYYSSLANGARGGTVTKYTSMPLAAALLEAGANANAFNGRILADAISDNRPESFIKLLHKNKADFNQALSLLEDREADDKIIKKLKVCREEYTGQPADENIAIIKDLRQQLAEAQEEITRLRKGQAEPAPAHPALRIRTPGPA